MTARCHGATSSAKPGFGETIYIAPAAVGALLNNAPTPWAVALAGYIGAVTYNLSTFCVNDPPAVPTFTALDVVNLLNPYNPLPFSDAQDKFQQLIGALVWNDLCQCNDASAPIIPTPPAAPANMPTINPVQVGPAYPSGTPCVSYAYDDFTILGTNQTIDTGPFPIADATFARINGQFNILTPFVAGSTCSAQILFFNSSGGSTGNFAVGAGTFGQVNNQQGAVPANTTSYSTRRTLINQGSSGNEMLSQMDMFCGTTPGGGGGVPTPCPTDPFVQAILDQILALVTIIQRQAAPFATVPQGTVHSGLTGDGHISLTGAIGAKITVTTIPPDSGLYSGDTTTIYDIGWFNWTGPDGATPREWISCSPQVSYPAAAGVFTGFSYSVRPGAELSVSIMSREP